MAFVCFAVSSLSFAKIKSNSLTENSDTAHLVVIGQLPGRSVRFDSSLTVLAADYQAGSVVTRGSRQHRGTGFLRPRGFRKRRQLYATLPRILMGGVLGRYGRYRSKT